MPNYPLPANRRGGRIARRLSAKTWRFRSFPLNCYISTVPGLEIERLCDVGTLQSHLNRNFKTQDSEISSVPTRDIYTQTELTARSCKSQGWCSFNIKTGKFLLFTKWIFALWCGAVPYKAPQTEVLGRWNYVSTNTRHIQTKRKKHKALRLSGMMQF
jgi:hypothetical protein